MSDGDRNSNTPSSAVRADFRSGASCCGCASDLAAIVPWLSPLFKSIELPGGWKVEFQELKREVAQKGQEVAALTGRVKQLESRAFTGKATLAFQETVREKLGALHAYFEGIGANFLHSETALRPRRRERKPTRVLRANRTSHCNRHPSDGENRPRSATILVSHARQFVAQPKRGAESIY